MPIGYEVDIAPLAAISAIWAAKRHILLAAEAHTTVAAIPTFHIYPSLIEEEGRLTLH